MNKEEIFPYEYSGGGYFREKYVPQGQKAKIIHGMEAVTPLIEKNKELEDKLIKIQFNSSECLSIPDTDDFNLVKVI